MTDFSLEKAAMARGCAAVCGCDEAGAGPLMGPVYAAAVILPVDGCIPGLDDSKKLTEKKREALFDVICQQAAWAVAAVPVQRDLLLEATVSEAETPMVAAVEGEELVADYASLRLTLGRHPLSLLRKLLDPKRYITAQALRSLTDNCPARCAGIVTGRQRPGTASGVIFLTLEDETGLANVIVHPKLAESQRRELLGSRLLGVLGVLQREGDVVHLIAKRLVDHSELLGRLSTSSRDFR